ncbi:MAG: SGNH/GDSL hydrolase family protein [Candidatus Omnitrophica bacterium]|nr:SGNH/GDSL hydrolase family protein [Candidatus Omnitrophota bacterium]
MNKILKLLTVVFLAMLIVEILLHLISFFYIHFQPKVQQDKIIGDNSSVRIMFIGDSWTTGSDAPSGEGFADKLIPLLRKKYPYLDIMGANYGKSGANSSEASIIFLRHYKKVKPTLLIVLIGINNAWNSQDVSLANDYLRNELSNVSKNKTKVSPLDICYFGLNKLKFVKLFKITYFHLVTQRKSLENPYPDTKYTHNYLNILWDSGGSTTKAREYLISKIDTIDNYDTFYRLMLFSFNQSAKKTEDYLNEKGIWRPWLLKKRFNQKQHDHNLALKYQLLDKQIGYLKQVCDTKNITLILQNYPYYGNIIFDEINLKLQEASEKYNITFIDNYQYFKDNLGLEGWKTVLTRNHINGAGHEFITQNLYNFIVKNKFLYQTDESNGKK